MEAMSACIHVRNPKPNLEHAQVMEVMTVLELACSSVCQRLIRLKLVREMIDKPPQERAKSSRACRALHVVRVGPEKYGGVEQKSGSVPR
jgi:hypothetical protein